MYRLTTYGLKLFSYLPFGVLYFISDLLYLILCKGFGYRKKVILENLRNSFPKKSEEEIEKIRDGFYKNLCDIMVESIKMISISKKELMKRNDCSSHKLIDELNTQGKTCFYFGGHVANWEWGPGVLSLASTVPVWIVYKKVTHESYDDMINDYRARFGAVMISMEQIARRAISSNGIKNICFIADQTPSNTGANTWVNFLNQDTLAFGASAKLAIKLNTPVIYSTIYRVKRGYYRYHFEVLFENPKDSTELEIMQAYFNRLEKDIIQHPDAWIWSHKRWKHKRVKNEE